MGRRKVCPDDIAKWMHIFEEEIKPVCIEKKLTLHEAFELFRETDNRLYQALSDFWHTTCGKYYLRDKFKGGYISVKREEKFNKRREELKKSRSDE